ncbi:hypothetical protein ACQ4M4_28645 [Leptolyngbya sp. AN02str]|uniref:hypothetical protein n=1 Tax=Leptolyngbya sp. AN02str TaxID=3423363 RepID=UPI003D313B88
MKRQSFGAFLGVAIATVAVLGLGMGHNVNAQDFRVANGYGGDYAYEVWRSRDNTWYQLRVWSRQSYPRGQGTIVQRSFPTSREALIHFDCQYARRRLPQCPNN